VLAQITTMQSLSVVLLLLAVTALAVRTQGPQRKLPNGGHPSSQHNKRPSLWPVADDADFDVKTPFKVRQLDGCELF
jgi:hypothetical protein